MKYGRQYKVVVYLALLLVAIGCANELPVDTDNPDEKKTTRIIFNSSGFTKADLQTPTDGNEDGIKTIDLFGFLWGHDQSTGKLKIMNFFHQQVKDKNMIVVESSYFEKSLRDEKGEYTNLYAIANWQYAGVTKIGDYDNLSKYVSTMVSKARSIKLGQEGVLAGDEEALGNLISTPSDFGHIDWKYPVMAKTLRVEGGASAISMPLERTHCRVGFSFLLTGNSTDEITINQIRIKKINIKGYLFKEENSNVPGDVFTWKYGGRGQFIRDESGTYYSQPLSPGKSKLTMCITKDGNPFYFHSFQYFCDDETEASTVEMDVTSVSDVKTYTRTLTAPLYNRSGTGTKKHYGLLRNHSYEVISTINSTTLELEDVTVKTHDWFDRGEVNIPEFQ